MTAIVVLGAGITALIPKSSATYYLQVLNRSLMFTVGKVCLIRGSNLMASCKKNLHIIQIRDFGFTRVRLDKGFNKCLQKNAVLTGPLHF